MITFNKSSDGSTSITIAVVDFMTVEEMLDTLEETLATNEDFQEQVLEEMPNDYDFIINQEKYGRLFTMGSPQIYECNWQVVWESEHGKSSLTIYGIR